VVASPIAASLDETASPIERHRQMRNVMADLFGSSTFFFSPLKNKVVDAADKPGHDDLF
jgi:hypothetical protein